MGKFVLVSGSRDMPLMHADAIYRVLETYIKPGDTMINGMARGVDTICYMWARNSGIEIAQFPADWAHYGRAAGAIRNNLMLDHLVDNGGETVLAFVYGKLYDSRGTKHCVDAARRRELTPMVWEF